ncbi:MarR family transcriptional regulator [Humibacter soli]
MTERDELTDRLQLLSEQDATQTALFQQIAASRYGFGVTDMKALSILLREGPQSAGALMSRLHVTSGAVTGIVDRLCALGVATRESDPADRRRIVVTAVPEGLTGRENVYAGIGRAFQGLYAEYTVDELRFLARHLERAVEITTEQTAILVEGSRQ